MNQRSGPNRPGEGFHQILPAPRLEKGPVNYQSTGTSQLNGQFIMEQQLGQIDLSKRVVAMEEEVREIKETTARLANKELAISFTKINSLPSEKYELKAPIDIIIKIFPEETIVLIPELEIYGEGKNEVEAVNDLKLELLDMIEDLEQFREEELGKNAKAWRKALDSMVRKCQ